MAFDLKDAGSVVETSAGDDGIIMAAPGIASPRPAPYKWSALWAYIQSKAGSTLGYNVGTSEGDIPLLGVGGKLPHGQMNLVDVPLTGTPTAPTAAPGTNTQQVATAAFVQAAITALINAAPGALDNLDELAAALGDDANFAATIANALALKAPLASPTFTGAPAAPTPTFGDATTKIATMEALAAALASLLVHPKGETNVASAATCDIGAAPTARVCITGTTGPITSFGTVANQIRHLRFADVTTIDHHATSLILPGGLPITTAAGDTFTAMSDGSGNWRVYHYQRADGSPLGASFAAASQAEAAAGTSNTKAMTPLRTKGVAGMWLLQTATASSSATVALTTGLDDTYDAYLVRISDVEAQTDDTWLRMRVDVGAGYATTGYQWGARAGGSAASADCGSTVDSNSTAIALTRITATSMLGNAATERLDARIEFSNPESTTKRHRFMVRSSYFNPAGALVYFGGAGSYDTTGALIGLQFSMSSGNIVSGTFRLYGLRKS